MNESENSINDMSIMPIAGLLRRLAALIYDLFLLAAMVMAYALLVITPLRISLYGMPSNDDNWAGLHQSFTDSRFNFCPRRLLLCLLAKTGAINGHESVATQITTI
jgi:hypothetical protein